MYFLCKVVLLTPHQFCQKMSETQDQFTTVSFSQDERSLTGRQQPGGIEALKNMIFALQTMTPPMSPALTPEISRKNSVSL